MKNFLETVSVAVLAENDKGQLKQNVRNDLRSDLLDSLVDTFKDLGVEAFRTEDGVAFDIPNETIGAVPVVVGVTIKDLAFDVVEAHEAFNAKLVEKEAKAKQAEALKAQKLAEKELSKAKRSTKK